MAYNEAETRYHLIDPVLRQKGFDGHQWLKLETPAPVEATGNRGRRRAGAGRTDYLLCVQVDGMPKPLPVGVIEAKAEGQDPLQGMQQAKGYADCTRFQVQYVFATNGHRYGEFDKPRQMPSGPFPFPDFPTHAELTARYTRDTGVDVTKPEAGMLFMADSAAYAKPRYYQDAAIRAAFEKILRCEQAGEPVRVLLSLATGAGKTVIAANLLWRLYEARRLTKPAFVPVRPRRTARSGLHQTARRVRRRRAHRQDRARQGIVANVSKQLFVAEELLRAASQQIADIDRLPARLLAQAFNAACQGA